MPSYRFSALVLVLVVLAGLGASITPIYALEWRGEANIELRQFANEPADTRQHRLYPSLTLEPEIYWEWGPEWGSGDHSLTFKPFYRYDQDPERSHVDIRELLYLTYGSDWELRAGITKVFWGVTESQHLVDIINQTDRLESPDGEDKLGQPMLQLNLIRDWGTLGLFLLPGFREQESLGVESRLRPPLFNMPVIYESGDKDRHIDFALRWSHTLGDADIGLSHFRGTSREPVITQQGLLYEQIDQSAIDLQYIWKDWLLKLEAIKRHSVRLDFAAMVAGFEYSLYGVTESGHDIGVLLEYHRDNRNQQLSQTPFQDDLFIGMRYILNDSESTEIIAGGLFDLEWGSKAYSFELSRRMSDHWTLEVQGQIYASGNQKDLMQWFDRDDYLQLNLGYFF